jgi:hypothetical protein
MLGRILKSKSVQKPCPERKAVDLLPNSKADKNSIKIQKLSHDVREIFKVRAETTRTISPADRSRMRNEPVLIHFLAPIWSQVQVGRQAKSLKAWWPGQASIAGASLFRAAHYRLIRLVFQQLNFAEWPQFCDHSVTSADVCLSVGPNLAVLLVSDRRSRQSRCGLVALKTHLPAYFRVVASLDRKHLGKTLRLEEEVVPRRFR